MRATDRSAMVGVAVMTTTFLVCAAGMARAADSGRNVCYKEVDVDGAPEPGDGPDSGHERLVLNVDRQADLSFRGGYTQTLFDARGKNTDTEGDNEVMAAAQGTIIVTSKGGAGGDFDHGAHMGLVAIWVRPDGAAKNYDCYSEQESPTPVVWRCAVRDQNEDLKFDQATLTRMAHPDRFCGIFQDDVVDDAVDSVP